jgi:mannose-6-phosphate isomerase-like protein (cupin superfamily)
MSSAAASFPGGTSVSLLDVYADEAPDGICGGSPHMHLVSTECYIVTAGEGALLTIDASGFRETSLRAGSVVWFTPGTIHRAVNRGDLSVVVLMGDSGLPEAGDAVMTFPADIVGDGRAYARAATLAPADDVAARAESAARRRDLAVEGFDQLRRAVESGAGEALRDFYAAAVALVRHRAAAWPEIVREAPLREAEAGLARATAVATGDGRHLSEGRVFEAAAAAGAKSFGMCGRLTTYSLG